MDTSSDHDIHSLRPAKNKSLATKATGKKQIDAAGSGNDTEDASDDDLLKQKAPRKRNKKTAVKRQRIEDEDADERPASATAIEPKTRKPKTNEPAPLVSPALAVMAAKPSVQPIDAPVVTETRQPLEPKQPKEGTLKSLKQQHALDNRDSTLSAMLSKASRPQQRAFTSLKTELTALQRQYDELKSTGIVEANKQFDKYKAAAEKRYTALQELNSHLTADNQRLTEEAKALSDKNTELLALLAQAGASDSVAAKPQPEPEPEPEPEPVIEKIDKSIYEQDMAGWRETCASLEAKAVDLEKAVSDTKLRHQELESSLASEKARNEATCKLLNEQRASLELTNALYNSLTSLSIQSVERVMRVAEEGTESQHEQSFNAFKCELKNSELDGSHHSCCYTPRYCYPVGTELPPNITAAQLVGSLDSLPGFLKEEVDFEASMTSKFFLSIANHLNQIETD
eukprot:jgi/Hompol1/3379/HPOL_003217-RA